MKVVLFHIDGWKDRPTDRRTERTMTKPIGAFSKFANASKMESKLKGISRKNNAIQENLNPNREKKGKCEIKRRILGK